MKGTSDAKSPAITGKAHREAGVTGGPTSWVLFLLQTCARMQGIVTKWERSREKNPTADWQDSDSAINWISSYRRYLNTATNLAETVNGHSTNSL